MEVNNAARTHSDFAQACTNFTLSSCHNQSLILLVSGCNTCCLRAVAQLVAELSTQRVAVNRPGAVISALAGYTVRPLMDVCLVHLHLKLDANLPVCK